MKPRPAGYGVPMRVGTWNLGEKNRWPSQPLSDAPNPGMIGPNTAATSWARSHSRRRGLETYGPVAREMEQVCWTSGFRVVYVRTVSAAEGKRPADHARGP